MYYPFIYLFIHKKWLNKEACAELLTKYIYISPTTY